MKVPEGYEFERPANDSFDYNIRAIKHLFKKVFW